MAKTGDVIELSSPIYHDEDAAREHLENTRWPNGPTCPYCGVVDNIKPLGGQSMGAGWYHCGDCKSKFTVRVGSVFERSHIPLHKWLLGFRLMASSKKGMSAHQLHRTLNITYKSAWFMAHRIREAMKEIDPGPLGGPGVPVEADETFIGNPGYEFRNEKGWVKKRSIKNMMKVVSLVERGGRARSVKVETVTLPEIRKVVTENVSPASTLMTDHAIHYKIIGKRFARHESVNHSVKEYARGDVSTNTIEGFFSIFKRGMRGIYQHCGEQHLQRYLTEFDFRYSNRKAGDTERTETALKGAEGRRLTYRQAAERAAA